MKRSILILLVICMCLAALCGAASAEAAPARDAAPLSAEELWQAGEDAWKTKEYDKANVKS